VSELVNDGLLEGRLALVPSQHCILERHLGARRTQCLAQLLRVEGVEVLVGDHEW